MAYAVPPSPCAAEEEVEAPPRRRLAVPSTPPRGEATIPLSASRPLVDPRYRFLARFGATILSGGIAAIPMALYHYQAALGLIPQEVWFVGYILAHRWTDALPFPSLRRMSRRTGVSTQMLHRYKQSLIEKGYLTTIPRHRPSGGRTSNYYDFTALFKALEESLQHDKRGTGWMPSVDDDGGDDGGEGIEAAPHPDQPTLTGVNQLTVIGDGEPAVSGPTLAELTAPARQNVPPKKTPNVQIPSLEPAQREARVPRGTPKRPSHSAGDRGPWEEALAKLAQELSSATISAWLEPLVCEPPAPDAPPGTPIRLRCASVFQLQQVNRRYRTAIERALGAPIELILTAA
ncbi:MAG TPA: hypothetical protein VFN74_25490 [Chloroflexota bacterium]|nr:hypothetical protein [Chloroflexota bacterium]